LEPITPRSGSRKGAPKFSHSIATRGPVGQLDAKAHTAWNDHDLLRLDLEHAHLAAHAQSPLLRHDQQLAIGIHEEPIGHRAIGRIQVDARSRSSNPGRHCRPS
jgi:hypothetical protein